VKEEADRLGLRTKARKPNNGSRDGGVPFRVGHLYKLLTNCLYIGEIGHKGQRYSGEHKHIVDRKVWDSVQAQLVANAPKRTRKSNDPSGSLLIGLLFDEDGKRIAPHQCNKKGRRYRYYVSRDPEAQTGWRLPAKTIETAVLDGITGFFGDRHNLLDALDPAAIPTPDIEPVLSRAEQLAADLAASGPGRQRSMLLDLVDRIDLTRHHVTIALRRNAVQATLGLPGPIPAGDNTASNILTIERPVTFKRRGVETKLIIGEAANAAGFRDRPLIDAVTTANAWFTALKSGEAESVRALADRHSVDKGDVSRILPLAFLAPDIVDTILDGRQPVDLTAYRLKRLRDLPPLWEDQRRLLGFA
jgi:hypothetical protein